MHLQLVAKEKKISKDVERYSMIEAAANKIAFRCKRYYLPQYVDVRRSMHDAQITK